MDKKSITQRRGSYQKWKDEIFNAIFWVWNWWSNNYGLLQLFTIKLFWFTFKCCMGPKDQGLKIGKKTKSWVIGNGEYLTSPWFPEILVLSMKCRLGKGKDEHILCWGIGSPFGGISMGLSPVCSDRDCTTFKPVSSLCATGRSIRSLGHSFFLCKTIVWIICSLNFLLAQDAPSLIFSSRDMEADCCTHRRESCLLTFGPQGVFFPGKDLWGYVEPYKCARGLEVSPILQSPARWFRELEPGACLPLSLPLMAETSLLMVDSGNRGSGLKSSAGMRRGALKAMLSSLSFLGGREAICPEHLSASSCAEGCMALRMEISFSLHFSPRR